MKVRRIVADLHTPDPAGLAAFYQSLLGMEVVMDAGFIQTLGGAEGPVQLSVASEGGAGTPVPALPVEVDDLEEALRRAKGLEAEIVHGPVEEPWGVRRFFLRDPAGHLVNVLTH